MKELGIDAKKADALKPRLLKLNEEAIGVVEEVLKLALDAEGSEGGEKKPKAPPPFPGAKPPIGGGDNVPPFLKKAASTDDLYMAASNIPGITSPAGDESLSGLSADWAALDRKKELASAITTSGR
jgi:hypothetical protein